MPPAEPLVTAGLTVREFARRNRIGPDRVRAMITSGALGAINTATSMCGKPRYVILPQHLAAFERQRAAGPKPKAPRRRKQAAIRDFYPD